MKRSVLIPNQTRLSKLSRARAYTSHLVTLPAELQLSHQGSTQRFKGSTRVTGARPNMLLAVAYGHGDQVTGVCRRT